MDWSLELINLLLAFAVAGVVAFGATPLAKQLSAKVGAIDVPKDNRRMHKVPIARLGGLAIFAGFMISVFIFLPLDRELISILIGATIVAALGAVDDVLDLGAKLKFVIQIGAALIPVLCGVRVEVLTNFNILSDNPYMNLGILSIPLTVIWIVGLTNAVNFIDGLDGLAVGVSSIASFCLLIIAVLVSEPDVALVTAALAGACLGFLPYNMNPAKIFMGDSGALFLGFVLANMSIQGAFKFYTVISFAVPFLILGVPIFDTSAAIIRRLREKRSPMSSDRLHIHHRLVDNGFSQRQSVAIMYTVSAVLGLSAVLMTGSGTMGAFVLLFIALALSVAGVWIFGWRKKHVHGVANVAADTKDPGREDDVSPGE